MRGCCGEGEHLIWSTENVKQHVAWAVKETVWRPHMPNEEQDPSHEGHGKNKSLRPWLAPYLSSRTYILATCIGYQVDLKASR
jgi:hypothetical protein